MPQDDQRRAGGASAYWLLSRSTSWAGSTTVRLGCPAMASSNRLTSALPAVNGRLADGAERWMNVFGQRDIVVAHDLHLPRHVDVALLERAENRDGGDVAGGKDGVKGQIPVEPLVDAGPDAGVTEQKRLLQSGVFLEASFVQGAQDSPGGAHRLPGG